MQGYREVRSYLLSISALVGLFMIALIHLVALFFYLYWFYWWLDTVMHLVGGFLVGLFVLGFFTGRGRSKNISSERCFFYLFISVLSVAISWEIFEIYIGYVDPSMGGVYWLETLADVNATLLGGCVAFAVLYYSRNLSVNN